MSQSLPYALSVAPDGTGVVLKIWEPAPKSRKPYLYQLNYKLASEALARQILNQHLAMLGGQHISDDQPLEPMGEFSLNLDAEPTVSLTVPPRYS